MYEAGGGSSPLGSLCPPSPLSPLCYLDTPLTHPVVLLPWALSALLPLSPPSAIWTPPPTHPVVLLPWALSAQSPLLLL